MLGEPSSVPTEWNSAQLSGKSGDELELQYRHTLEELAKAEGLIGTIFRKSMNKLSDPAKLTRVVSLIDNEGPWIGIGVDVKGEIYEGLLESNASEVKSGAGQYFTPRPVIEAIIECVDPQIGETVCDPACGTGGFLLSAYDHMKGQSQDRDKLRKLREETFTGVDIVDEVVRLSAMTCICTESATLSASDIAEQPIIGYPKRARPVLHDVLWNAFRQIGAQPNIVCELIDKSTLLQFVAHGLGLALAPAWVQNIAPPGVTFVPFEPCATPIELYVAFRKAGNSETVERFLEVVRTAAAESVSAQVV